LVSSVSSARPGAVACSPPCSPLFSRVVTKSTQARLVAFCLTVLAIAFGGRIDSAHAAEDPIRDSAVKIHNTARRPDFMRPWTKATPKKSTGSGAIISGNQIITNAHVVLYAHQLFVQFNDSTDRHAAKVKAIAPNMDLAVVELEDPSLLEGRPALELQSGIPDFKSTVNVYGFPIGGDDLAVTEGIISRIEYASYFQSGAGLRIQVDAPLNPGNSGGPAIVDGKVVGLVFSKISQADNIGYLIPTDEIELFLEDVKDDTYDGKPNIFDTLQTTENDSLRARLGMASDVTGIMVKSPYREDDYPLQIWDVITKIGPHEIDNKGHVKVREDLRLLFKHFIPEFAKDGSIELTVMRDGEKQTIAVPVQPKRDELIPELSGAYPRHFIYGPMVFTVGTRDLVRSFGSKGPTFLSAMDSPLIGRTTDKPAFEGEELVVFRMLPHRVTKGYGNLPFGVVDKINDVEVKSLKHLVELLRDCSDEFITYEIAGNYETVVFRTADMEATTEEVLSDEGIRYQFSKDLEAIWEAEPAEEADSEEEPAKSEKEPEKEPETAAAN